MDILSMSQARRLAQQLKENHPTMSSPIANKPWVRVFGTIGGSDNVPKQLCIRIKCIGCFDIHSFTVKEEDFDNWVNGELIQRCFKTLDVNDRELFISGICGKCFPSESDE